MLRTVLQTPTRIALSLLLLALSACGTEPPRSAAAEVSGEDPRRLPPDRRGIAPDVILATADQGRVLATDSTARVHLFVVSDYQCASCRTWFERTLPELRRDYVETGKVKLIWTQYPLREHAGAVRAASGAACASAQGDFWGASTRLFASQALWAKETVDTVQIDSIARGSTVDAYTFNLCQQGKRLHRLIRTDIDFVDTLHAGAPLTLIVNTRVVPGDAPLATLRAVLDSAIAAAK